jgi:hypothetical protein
MIKPWRRKRHEPRGRQQRHHRTGRQHIAGQLISHLESIATTEGLEMSGYPRLTSTEIIKDDWLS